MSQVAIRACRWCRTRQTVEVWTEAGRLVEAPLRCGCAEKREARLCIDCGEPHGGAIQRLRCDPCKVVAQRESTRRYRDTHREELRARERRKYRKGEKQARRTKKRGDAIRARDREYRNRPEVRARRLEQRRRRNLADMGAAKAASRRRYEERHPDRVQEQQRRTNARPERIASKREWAHLYQTRYAGTGDKPTCRQDGCENEVPWDGQGRPRLDCFACRPLDSRERKSARIVELAAQQEAA